MTAKQRDVRLLELTSSELKSLPGDTKVYEGVGKMCVSHLGLYEYALILVGRFVHSPTATVEKRLLSTTSELKSDISNLNKKLHYLETTHKNSREHINQIFKSGGRS